MSTLVRGALTSVAVAAPRARDRLIDGNAPTGNPDFGQVEVDPAVVNLSAFETLFREKRPFFAANQSASGSGTFKRFFCSDVSSLDAFHSPR